jgi:hypothetical protein
MIQLQIPDVLINTGNYHLSETSDLTTQQINDGLTPFEAYLKQEKTVRICFEVQYER